ncbi:hypothetical protein MGSAQ_001763 [marine sediment metagenome]|uniref:Uncharacterized protein n=1 Tax=marine sediment metagenome TaxID=412755 RepID=A0A1B6NTU5_9ZZZZ
MPRLMINSGKLMIERKTNGRFISPLRSHHSRYYT